MVDFCGFDCVCVLKQMTNKKKSVRRPQSAAKIKKQGI
jgi:hypothetical protein